MAREQGSIRWHRGGWEISWHEGTRRRYRRLTAPNNRNGRRQAETELERLLNTTGEPTVTELLDQYRVSKWSGWSPSTRASWPSHTKQIAATLGERVGCEVTAAQIERAYSTWMADGTSAATVRRRHTILSAAMIRAERLGIIALAPTRRVQVPSAPDKPPVDLPDVAGVLTALQGLSDGTWIKAAARLTVATGMRRGELCALRWIDIDLDDACLWVRGALATDDDGTVKRKATKARRASAAEALDPGTVAVLAAWRTQCRIDATTLGVEWSDRWPVFGARTDPRRWMNPARITHLWARVRQRIDLDGVRWHDLRHINATELIAAGIDPTTAARRLGHDPAMLLGRYAHARPVQDRQAADVIAAADEKARRGE